MSSVYYADSFSVLSAFAFAAVSCSIARTLLPDNCNSQLPRVYTALDSVEIFACCRNKTICDVFCLLIHLYDGCRCICISICLTI